ncbi:MAG: glycosyltransferase family 2 protein [Lachnospiraceae bacterium]|nr:glycosyltransferase family 2 protein [Lachnospiraceae bacterium]
MHFHTDAVFLKDQMMNITGWASGEDGENDVSFSVSSGGKTVDHTLIRASRPDVGYAMFKSPDIGEVGYYIQFPSRGIRTFAVTASRKDSSGKTESSTIVINSRLTALRRFLKDARAWWAGKKYKDSSLVYKVWNRTLNKYNAWFKNFRTSALELSEQKKTVFSYQPLISILVPVYRTPLLFLRDMLSSVVNQSYPRFELCIVNADPSDETVSRELALWASLDERIRVRDLAENRSIAENTNEAFSMARGEFVAMLDHDDKLEHDALYQYVKRLNEKPETDMIYCDEDKISEKPDYYFFPNFKPDFNRDMLYANNYICHFLCVRKTLAEEAGLWDREYNGAQDYDFILRCLEKTDRIEHVDRVLYHWRSYNASTSKNHGNKSYAEDAGKRALNAHFRRMGYHAQADTASIPGWYNTRFSLQGSPLVSILIPSKDHSEDLDIAIRSVLTKCTYRNLEIIVIENNSTEKETFEYYRKIQQEFNQVHVVTWPGKGFNYSAINNYGFRVSKGEYILLLNNDVEVITPDMMESMLGYFDRKDVGMVGCKLLYKDNTIQHAGVLVGGGGLADHLLKGYKDSAPAYMCRGIVSYDVSAVTAACLMMPRKVYEEVGGLEEDLAVAFNDVDLCLKVREKGYTIVYDAQAKLHHYESKSRGAENTPEKYRRFAHEMDYLSRKWRDRVAFNDPNYNRNMSYLYNFIPDFFAIPDRSLELGEAFVRHTNDPVGFELYIKDNLSRKYRKSIEKGEKRKEKEKAKVKL